MFQSKSFTHTQLQFKTFFDISNILVVPESEEINRFKCDTCVCAYVWMHTIHFVFTNSKIIKVITNYAIDVFHK